MVSFRFNLAILNPETEHDVCVLQCELMAMLRHPHILNFVEHTEDEETSKLTPTQTLTLTLTLTLPNPKPKPNPPNPSLTFRTSITL